MKKTKSIVKNNNDNNIIINNVFLNIIIIRMIFKMNFFLIGLIK